LKGSEDTSSAATVAALQAASGSGGTPTPLATKQPLPFVQVTMNDYMDDDDLPATVSFFLIHYPEIENCVKPLAEIYILFKHLFFL
jgi:hypothetical protein